VGRGYLAGMARPLRVRLSGAVYHVTFRGNERRAIFRTDGDRRRLLAQMAVARELTQARLYLVCLMPNHVQLLLETPRGNLSEFMGRLLTAYPVYYNRRHRRVGHLTQGRYGAQLVEGNEYLLTWALSCHAGLDQRAIAGVLGMGSGAGVSLQLAKWRRVKAKEARWGEIATQIERRLTRENS
jgi:REP element-mobilizing transposase RayT